MSDYSSPAGMIEPELLVATCAADGSVLSRNSAWLNLLGSSPDIWSNLPLDDAEIARQNLKEASHGSLVTHALFMVNRAERDIPIPVLLHFIPVQENHPTAACSVAISGEVLSEPSTWTESQTHRHRMETLGRMTMGMTHDFNNMLSGILGHIELWKIEGSANAELHLATIEKAARDGAELISKVQRYIRQEVRTAFEPIDLTALVSECISFTKPYWYNEPRRQGIDISITSTLDELPLIDGSASELRDVFVNLILNAVHAMPSGGQVVFSGKSDGQFVEIVVLDTGTGMSKEVQKQIFEPLFTTKGDRGTGMGLAVAAGILREHGGSISVSSTLGVGSVFTLQLPTNISITAPTAQPVPQLRSNTARRILVVDDEEMVLGIISKLLSIRGHQVIEASSGPEAIAKFETGLFDFVITDQGMPEMSGRELAYQIRKVDSVIPIILLTGDTEIRVDGGAINRVMTKPFKIDELEALMSELS